MQWFFVASYLCLLWCSKQHSDYFKLLLWEWKVHHLSCLSMFWKRHKRYSLLSCSTVLQSCIVLAHTLSLPLCLSFSAVVTVTISPSLHSPALMRPLEDRQRAARGWGMQRYITGKIGSMEAELPLSCIRSLYTSNPLSNGQDPSRNKKPPPCQQHPVIILRVTTQVQFAAWAFPYKSNNIIVNR